LFDKTNRLVKYYIIYKYIKSNSWII